jgi:hypothetical protein
MDAHEHRLRRQAKALETIKAIRPIGHPEHPAREIALRHTALAGADPNAPGVVYFLYCAGRLKIGYTTDLKRRLEDFNTHCPFPATLLLTIRGLPEHEERFHEMFSGDRIRGEWFNLSLDLREFLERHFEFGTTELMLNAEEECMDFFAATEHHPILALAN